MVKRSTNLSGEGLVRHQVSQTTDCFASVCQQGNSELAWHKK